MLDDRLADFIVKCCPSRSSTSILLFDPSRYPLAEQDPAGTHLLLQQYHKLLDRYGSRQTFQLAQQTVALVKSRAARRQVQQLRKHAQAGPSLQTFHLKQKERQYQHKSIIKIQNEKTDADALWGTSYQHAMKKILEVADRFAKEVCPIMDVPTLRPAEVKALLVPSLLAELSFPGHIEIAERGVAINQAALESSQSKFLIEEPGRRYFFTDAGGSSRKAMGIGVAWKDYQPDGTSQWVARGSKLPYSRNTNMPINRAEALAIWLALQIVAEMMGTGTESSPIEVGRCTRVVVYTDSQSVLSALSQGPLVHERLLSVEAGEYELHAYALIIKQAYELKRLGIDVELRWVKGHVLVPGNELADKIAGMAARSGNMGKIPRLLAPP